MHKRLKNQRVSSDFVGARLPLLMCCHTNFSHPITQLEQHGIFFFNKNDQRKNFHLVFQNFGIYRFCKVKENVTFILSFATLTNLVPRILVSLISGQEKEKLWSNGKKGQIRLTVAKRFHFPVLYFIFISLTSPLESVVQTIVE